MQNELIKQVSKIWCADFCKSSNVSRIRSRNVKLRWWLHVLRDIEILATVTMWHNTRYTKNVFVLVVAISINTCWRTNTVHLSKGTVRILNTPVSMYVCTKECKYLHLSGTGNSTGLASLVLKLQPRPWSFYNLQHDWRDSYWNQCCKGNVYASEMAMVEYLFWKVIFSNNLLLVIARFSQIKDVEAELCFLCF